MKAKAEWAFEKMPGVPIHCFPAVCAGHDGAWQILTSGCLDARPLICVFDPVFRQLGKFRLRARWPRVLRTAVEEARPRIAVVAPIGKLARDVSHRAGI